MAIPIFSVCSLINQDLDQLSARFLGELEQALHTRLALQGPEQISEADPCIVYIASGGSEIQFVPLVERITCRNIYLLTSGYSNSLAASLEILSYLRMHGRHGEILHGDIPDIAARLSTIIRAANAKKALKGGALGLIGTPSDWLIASHTDRAVLAQKLSMRIVDIPIDALVEEYEAHHYEQTEWTEKLLATPFDRDELKKALDIYGALDRLVQRYGLMGLSVRCFDLLSRLQTTGCLGLAILNARGVYAGCESDMPSLVSMAILGALSTQPVFMCNPSRIDTAKGEMVFAHCTLPLNMPYTYELNTHFESGIGIAIAGSIPEGSCTVFKASGDLSEYFVDSGTICENLRENTLCRSQIRVSLPSHGYFLQKPISNHHLICCGDHTETANCFFSML